MSVRRRLGKKGGAGLVSAIAPVAVGVLLAYAWNAAGAAAPHGFQSARVPNEPYVGTAAEQAAAQAWERMTPAASSSAATSGPSFNGISVPAGCAQANNIQSCLAAHGYRGYLTYQPASRFWAFQGIETGIFVVLAAILLAVTFWVLKRRDA